MIPNSKARQIIIKSLAFENGDSLCKMIIRLLKARLVPLKELIWDKINIESHEHGDLWIKVWGTTKMSNVVIVANKDILKGNVNKASLETMFSIIIYSEHSSFLDYAEGVAKAGIGLMM